MDRGAWQATIHGVIRGGHDGARTHTGFTMLCYFLLYRSMNSLYVYIYPLLPEPPSYPTGLHQWVKNLPVTQETQETWVQSLGWEDPLEKEMATCSSILALKPNGQRSLEGYSLWDRKEWDTTKHADTAHPARTSQSTEFCSLFYGSFPLAVCFTDGDAYMSVLLSQFVPASLPPLCPQSLLYVCISIPALQIICTILLDSIYMRKYTIFVFLFLTYFTPYDRLWVHPLHYK